MCDCFRGQCTLRHYHCAESMIDWLYVEFFCSCDAEKKTKVLNWSHSVLEIFPAYDSRNHQILQPFQWLGVTKSLRYFLLMIVVMESASLWEIPWWAPSNVYWINLSLTGVTRVLSIDEQLEPAHISGDQNLKITETLASYTSPGIVGFTGNTHWRLISLLNLATCIDGFISSLNLETRVRLLMFIMF